MADQKFNKLEQIYKNIQNGVGLHKIVIELDGYHQKKNGRSKTN